MLEQGEAESAILKQCAAQNLPLPERIKNAPELDYGLWFYMNAFYELESERPMGMDIGPIPRRAIREFALELDMDDEEFDDLYHHIRALDITFLKHRSKKNKA